MERIKTTWLLGDFEKDVEPALVEKGFVIRKFNNPGSAMLFDEQPDMILFSELTSENCMLFVKINQFFPNVLIMSLANKIKDKTDNNVLLDHSMQRLISSLKNIEGAF